MSALWSLAVGVGLGDTDNCGLEQAQFPPTRHSLRPAVHLELAVDIAGVGLDRVQREEEPGSDLGIGQPCGDEFEYLAFALGQRLDQLGLGDSSLG